MSDIITAIKIADVTKMAVLDPEIKQLAEILLSDITGLDVENFNDNYMDMLYIYSAIVASTTATLVAEAILGKEDFDKMYNDIMEFESIKKEVLGE